MSVHRNELLKLYVEKVLLVQASERDSGRTELVQSANNYLNTADPRQRFSEQIVAIFSTNIGTKTSFDFVAARNVFSIMEKYVINLLDCPWKREFRKITMYSGFYKTRIEPSLKDAWKLLLMVGYEKIGLSLELKVLPDASRLQDAAFEFYLASLECLIYKDVFQRVSSLGFTLKDIHKCRRSVLGNSDVIFKALSKLSLSQKRDEGGSYDLRASSQAPGDFSKLPKQFEKHSGYEAKVGARLSESGQQQIGSVSKVGPRPDLGTEGNGSETRTESIEAMLQEITPEMISDINIRRQILTKLNAKPQSAVSPDEPFHASLPLHRVLRESDTRPYTEPLLIPKQPKPNVASASDMQPYSEPLVMPNRPRPILPYVADEQPNIIRKHRKPDVQRCAEPLPVPEQQFTGDSNRRPCTEPLFIPQQEKVPSKLSSKSTETICTPWQCTHCSYSNSAAVSLEGCEMCGRARQAF